MASIYKKLQYRTDPTTRKRVASKSKKWYGRYRNADGTEHRVPLATDKRLAQQMLNDILAKIERQKAGLDVEEIAHLRKVLSEHIDDFEQHLRAKNDKPRHIRETINMIKCVAREQKWRDLRDVKASRLEAFLNKLWNVKHLSISRGNHYIRTLKTFGHWLVDDDRLLKHPFISSRLSTLKRIGDIIDVRSVWTNSGCSSTPLRRGLRSKIFLVAIVLCVFSHRGVSDAVDEGRGD
ncbi:MAG: hypothetical protein Q4C95_12045 [Planctomycetia bacterium]|nr:hypothetical protein [Planctomycetia bacterium]